MISCQTKAVRGGETENIAPSFISEFVSRTVQRGFQKPFIANAFQAAMFGKRRGMQQQKCSRVNPPRLLHLARARKVSRYSFMNFSPSFTCSSTSGS